MDPPKPCSGSSGQAIWNNQLRAYCISIALRSGRNYNLVRSPQGTALDLQPSQGGAATKAQGILLYTFVSHGTGIDSDFIFATPIGGTGPGEKILKPPLLRFSVTERDVYGIKILYSGYDPVKQSRVAASGPYTITQFITPQYVLNDLIYVLKIGPDKVDINVDGRTFAGP